MKRQHFLQPRLAILLLILTLAMSCERTPTPSPYVENQPPERPDPVITTIEPAGEWLAGFGTITIRGQNFSPVASENLVYFGTIRATVLSASPTELVVQSPRVTGQNLPVRISVIGAYLYSNIVSYTLSEAVAPYSDYGISLSEQVQVLGLGVDKNENLYVSADLRRIDKITPDGEKQRFFATIPGNIVLLQANRLRVGPGGWIYATRKFRRIFRISEDGSTVEQFTSVASSERVYDVDFDQNGNFYAVSDGDNILLVKPDGTSESVAEYTGTFLKSVKIYNGFLYVAGEAPDGTYKVWRNQINAVNDLGPGELVFDLTAALGPTAVLEVMAIAEDGDLYLGINGDEPVLIVHPDGSHEPLYPGLWKPEDAVRVSEVYDIVWGNGNFAYMTRRHVIRGDEGNDVTVHQVLKVNLLKKGAPYFGRN